MRKYLDLVNIKCCEQINIQEFINLFVNANFCGFDKNDMAIVINYIEKNAEEEKRFYFMPKVKKGNLKFEVKKVVGSDDNVKFENRKGDHFIRFLEIENAAKLLSNKNDVEAYIESLDNFREFNFDEKENNLIRFLSLYLQVFLKNVNKEKALNLYNRGCELIYNGNAFFKNNKKYKLRKN